MRKLILTAGIVLVIAATTQMAAASGRGPLSEKRYEVKPSMGHTIVERKAKAAIRHAIARWSVSGGVPKAFAIAYRESRFWPWSHNGDCSPGGSGSCGEFQHKRPYWDERARTWLRERWFPRMKTGWLPGPYNLRANVLVTIRMVHAAGWGPRGG